MIQPARLTIREIQTSELLYYDPAYGRAGYEFCQNRDIDCLPSLDNPFLFYRRNDETQDFEAEELVEGRCISAHQSIFYPQLLERLRTYHILFVIDDDELCGVVHFADYNKQVVSNFLYTCLANYERNLRQLALLSGLTNADMGSYFREKMEQREAKGEDPSYFRRKLDAFEREAPKLSQTPPFQLFYLDDLLGLLKHRDIVTLQGNVRELRNAIMHAHELVNLVDVTTPDYIYDFASFETFFEQVQALLHDARRVENRIRFMANEE